MNRLTHGEMERLRSSVFADLLDLRSPMAPHPGKQTLNAPRLSRGKNRANPWDHSTGLYRDKADSFFKGQASEFRQSGLQIVRYNHYTDCMGIYLVAIRNSLNIKDLRATKQGGKHIGGAMCLTNGINAYRYNSRRDMGISHVFPSAHFGTEQICW